MESVDNPPRRPVRGEPPPDADLAFGPLRGGSDAEMASRDLRVGPEDDVEGFGDDDGQDGGVADAHGSPKPECPHELYGTEMHAMPRADESDLRRRVPTNRCIVGMQTYMLETVVRWHGAPPPFGTDSRSPVRMRSGYPKKQGDWLCA